MEPRARPHALAPSYVALAALLSAFGAHLFGWGFLIRAFSGDTRGAYSGGWLLGGAGLSLIFNGLAMLLATIALVLRRGKNAPLCLPMAIVALVLGVVGLLGVALLGLLGLV